MSVRREGAEDYLFPVPVLENLNSLIDPNGGTNHPSNYQGAHGEQVVSSGIDVGLDAIRSNVRAICCPRRCAIDLCADGGVIAISETPIRVYYAENSVSRKLATHHREKKQEKRNPHFHFKSPFFHSKIAQRDRHCKEKKDAPQVKKITLVGEVHFQ
jgi:hypothetical protein